METAADVIAHAPKRHRPQRGGDHLERASLARARFAHGCRADARFGRACRAEARSAKAGVMLAKQEQQFAGPREFWLITEAAAPSIEDCGKFGHCLVERV